jgi:hypothetical protein
MTATKRDDALSLAEVLLTDIELGRTSNSVTIRKASRLARPRSN